MKKIPTLFERVYENHKIVKILPNVTKGFEWVLEGEGMATVKIDGSCCSIINGELYKRYDAKKGKEFAIPIPEGAIKCQNEPDPVTGHFPCWVKCNRNNPADKWFWEAYDNSGGMSLVDGTFEAIGKHFNGNPYNLNNDYLIRHGSDVIYDLDLSFDDIKEFLKKHQIEGIVFWRDGEPQCKIKRSDFGFEWPTKNACFYYADNQ